MLISCEQNFPTLSSKNSLTLASASVQKIIEVIKNRIKLVESTSIPNSIEVIENDMTLPHEGRPHGVPLSYDWALNPRMGLGNNPGNFTAMTAWGQVYEDHDGNPANNTRVQLRNIEAYVLSKHDQQWRILQSSVSMYGAAYGEDFVGHVHRQADIRNEADGSISVTAGEGYNFHFWPPDRVEISPSDIAGIFTTVQARLILDDPDGVDDRENARYLVNMGGDYWLNLTAEWSLEPRTVQDIAIGRFKYVTTRWQSFNMTTLSEAGLQLNPPPLLQHSAKIQAAIVPQPWLQ